MVKNLIAAVEVEALVVKLLEQIGAENANTECLGLKYTTLLEINDSLVVTLKSLPISGCLATCMTL